VEGGPELFFRDALRELGYLEGQNLLIERRYTTGQLDRLNEQVAELVALPIDAIVTSGTPSTTEAASQATNTVPIVMLYSGDPVAAGLVASLAHPGSNVTGVIGFQAQLAPKRLELLKDTVPSIARVAVPQNPDAASNRLTEPGGSLQVAAQQLGMQLVHMDVKGPEDLDTALEAGTRAGADAILWGGTQAAGDFRHPAYRSRLAALAAQYRLPTMSAFAGWAQAGILMTYGSSTAAQFRRAAAYVDKILKGVKPADLPVEQPMTFDFVINLKTAQALGLTIPHHVLLQATEVIQ
jgi:putative tryptophan/tyrosine transport system substrate-binding protein